MPTNLWEQAEHLASRRYSIEVLRDQSSDGQNMYLARHPELPGCMAQGSSIDDAIAELDSARLDYIFSLLEDDLPVPDPVSDETGTGDIHPSQQSITIKSIHPNADESVDDEERELYIIEPVKA